MSDDLIDRIYEAAVVPELWSSVLESAGDLSGSANGAIFVFKQDTPIRGRFSDASPKSAEALKDVRPLFDKFLASDSWNIFPGVMRMHELQPARFVQVEDFMTSEEIANDPQRIAARAVGIGVNLCAAVPLPTGELVTVVFQRWLKDASYDPASIARMDALRPHFARAGMMAARLRLEQAKAATATLEALGLAAAVLSGAGRVVTANARLEEMRTTFIAAAHGKAALANPAANALFQDAIADNRHNEVVRSIPVPAGDDGEPPLVVHVLPLRRAAHDIFSGAEVLVVATPVTASAIVPSPSVLAGLFDLTPAEARLAAALSQGRALKDAAADSNITFKSGRTYLERIFAKTGTHQQSELVALLKSAERLAGPADAAEESPQPPKRR
jgi:DNA-binding CsgD family transcriptional regulator